MPRPCLTKESEAVESQRSVQVADSQRSIRTLLEALLQEHDRMGRLLGGSMEKGSAEHSSAEHKLATFSPMPLESAHGSQTTQVHCPCCSCKNSGRMSGSSMERQISRRNSRQPTLEKQQSAAELDKFAKFLVDRYRSLQESFRAIDANDSGTVSKGEFLSAIEDMGYKGEAQQLWALLSQSGILREEEFNKLSKFFPDKTTTGTSSLTGFLTMASNEQLKLCVHKLQTKLQNKRNYITNSDVVELMLQDGKMGQELPLDAINELFMFLGANAKGGVQNQNKGPAPSLSVSFSKKLTRSMSSPSTAIAGPELKVSIFKFAELLIEVDSKPWLEVHSEKMLDVVSRIKALVLDDDVVAFILAATDLKQSDFDQSEEGSFDKLLDLGMSMVILANAICIGIFATSSSVGWQTPQTVDLIFTLIFLLEMSIKMCKHGIKTYFMGQQWLWNTFDALVVGLGISDAIMTAALALRSSEGGRFNASSFMAARMIRLARVVRLARLLRVSLFRELKLMLNGIGGLMRTLFCAMLLLLLTIYLLAICVTQTFGAEESAVVAGQPMLFSTLPRSMFTVFRCLMVGDCSAIDGTPVSMQLIEGYGWPYALVYCTACVLMNYGLGSLITALVVDSTLQSAKQAEFKQSRKSSEKQKLGSRLKKLASYFEEFQREVNEHKGEPIQEVVKLFMDRVSFASALQSDVVKQLLDDIEIDEADRLDLFDALDADGNGRIELGELIEGIVKMRGKARKADTVATRLMLTQMVNEVKRIEQQMREHHQELLECMMGATGEF